jgi:hypothetical protein
LLDQSGRVLNSLPFEVSELSLETAAVAGDGRGAGVSFRVAVEPPAGLAGFRIYAGDQLAFERHVQGPAPALDTASVLIATQSDLRTTRWSLSALPAAAHYRLRFSPDGGGSWLLLAYDASAPVVDLPAALLAGADRAIIEVQASDGVRSASQVFPLVPAAGEK